MTGHLEAIEQHVAAITLTLPEGIDGEGPIRQALGEIVAEATALDSALDAAAYHADGANVMTTSSPDPTATRPRMSSEIEKITHIEEEKARLVINGTRYEATRFRKEWEAGRPWSGWLVSRFGGQRYTYVRSQPRDGFATLNDVIAFAGERWP